MWAPRQPPDLRLRRIAPMRDLGQPSSYLLLKPDTPVYSSDDVYVGMVTRVLAALDEDIFDGIVINVGDGERFVGGADVREVFDDGVELRLDAAACEQLAPPR